MSNKTTTADARTVTLTVPQIDALLTAAAFISSGEWDETVTASQKNTLDRAVKNLHAALAKTGN